MISAISVIGVGRMGGGIARNLAQNPHFIVKVFDFNAEAVARSVAVGATAAGSISEAVEGADLVITSLPLPETVVDVYKKNLSHSPSGNIWMDVSTIDPTTAGLVEAMVQKQGSHFVACPLGKGPAQAEAGLLPLFVGCEEQLLAELKPVFTCIGENVHYLGSVAAATTFKVVSNMVGMANLAVLAEGYALCSAKGVGDDSFTAALQDTGAWSNQAVVRLPWMIEGDFANRFGVDLAVKDVRLAVDIAAREGISVPVGAAGLMQLVAASAHGFGAQDVAAVLKVSDPKRCD